MEVEQSDYGKKHKVNYNLRCDAENCKRLAKQQPASDGNHYCKRHHPDLQKEIQEKERELKEAAENVKLKDNDYYQKKHEELIEKHFNEIHVDGVEIEPQKDNNPKFKIIDEEPDEDEEEYYGEDNMEIPKILKKPEPEQPAPQPIPIEQPKSDPTLTLKLSLAELSIDHMAHTYLINAVYEKYAQLGLPQHIFQSEIARLIAPHQKRVADIEAVLGQFNETV